MVESELRSLLKRAPDGTKPVVIQHAFRGPKNQVGPRDELTHWIHWYPAKMFRRIPIAILDALTIEAPMTLLDPYCGSGTVLLEAAARGHMAIGIDILPLARMISRVKTTRLDPSHLSGHCAQLQSVPADSDPRSDAFLRTWFKPEVLNALNVVASSLRRLEHIACREFMQVSLSSVVRSVSLADPSIAPTVRLRRDRTRALRYQRAVEHMEQIDGASVLRYFASRLDENLKRMGALWGVPTYGAATVLGGSTDAAHTHLPPHSIDLILTSPPYCGAQKYARAFRLEMLLLGSSREEVRQIERSSLGSEDPLHTGLHRCGRLADRYLNEIGRSDKERLRIAQSYVGGLWDFAEESSRVLRHDGAAFVVLGNSTVAGVGLPVDEIFGEAAAAFGLRHLITFVDPIPSRGMITTRHKTAGRIDEERVMWLKPS